MFQEVKDIEEYYNLLQQAKVKIEGLRGTIRSVCREFIPKMYKTLKENSQLSPEDARKKIERDCSGIWSKRTILEALPDETKNIEKQKAGRLRQKRLNSAAFPAAQLGYGSDYSAPAMIRKGKRLDVQIIECEGCQELLSENMELKEALNKVTVLTRADELESASIEGKPIQFDFDIPLKDVLNYIATLKTPICWFNVTIDTKTNRLVTATVGKC